MRLYENGTVDLCHSCLHHYTYDANGNRIGKTYEEVLYYKTGSGTTSAIRYPITATYSYLGDVLTYAYILDASERDSGNSTLMHFTYDELGPMSVNYNGTEYFYLKNAQGDVTGLVNTSGTQVVAYTYDAWGNPLTTTGSMASTLGKDNPFRYRRYFYDTETGVYYLGRLHGVDYELLRTVSSGNTMDCITGSCGKPGYVLLQKEQDSYSKGSGQSYPHGTFFSQI